MADKPLVKTEKSLAEDEASAVKAMMVHPGWKVIEARIRNRLEGLDIDCHSKRGDDVVEAQGSYEALNWILLEVERIIGE